MLSPQLAAVPWQTSEQRLFLQAFLTEICIGNYVCFNMAPFLCQQRTVHSWGSSPPAFSPWPVEQLMVRSWAPEFYQPLDYCIQRQMRKARWKESRSPELSLHPQCVSSGMCRELLGCFLSPKSARQKGLQCLPLFLKLTSQTSIICIAFSCHSCTTGSSGRNEYCWFYRILNFFFQILYLLFLFQ